MSVRILGLDTVRARLRSEMADAISVGEQRVVGDLIAELKKATPVDTGEARDGWHQEGNRIVNHVDHIDALNSGSSVQAPTHFIEQTILENKDVVPNGVIVTTLPHN